jgi:hypothetical protein
MIRKISTGIDFELMAKSRQDKSRDFEYLILHRDRYFIFSETSRITVHAYTTPFYYLKLNLCLGSKHVPWKKQKNVDVDLVPISSGHRVGECVWSGD